MIFSINGREIPVSGMHAEKAIASTMFKEWASRLDSYFVVRGIEFQSVDLKGKLGMERVSFLKFKVDVVNPDGEPVIPGIVFMRGGSVSILPILHCDDGKTYTILVRQPRFPTGRHDFPEIPAGMLDGEGNFAGVAARELEEELGMKIRPEDMWDLGHHFYGIDFPGMYPSPGACDEFIALFVFERNITLAELEKFRGKRTGLETEHERITLSVIPFKDLPYSTSDGKSLASFGLYMAHLATGLEKKI